MRKYWNAISVAALGLSFLIAVASFAQDTPGPGAGTPGPGKGKAGKGKAKAKGDPRAAKKAKEAAKPKVL